MTPEVDAFSGIEGMVDTIVILSIQELKDRLDDLRRERRNLSSQIDQKDTEIIYLKMIIETRTEESQRDLRNSLGYETGFQVYDDDL